VTANIENYRRASAIEYAIHGWPVMPLHYPLSGPRGLRCSCGDPECGSDAKHPIRELAPNGLKNATTDEKIITEWWERYPSANIGIPTGADAGIVVLDVDANSGGFTSLAEEEKKYGELPRTAKAITGSGGWHLIFKHPGRRVMNSVGAKGWLRLPGVDIRGDGGYIVAAPSKHITGGNYAWDISPKLVELADVPAWMLVRLDEREKERDGASNVLSERREKDDACTFWLGKALARCTVGSRNETGFQLACQLRDAKVSERDAEKTLVEYSERCPQPAGELRYKAAEAIASVRSAYQQPPREPARSPNGRGTINGNGHAEGNSRARRRRELPEQSELRVTSMAEPVQDASAELKSHLADIASRKIGNIPFYDWPVLSALTQALIPGSLTMFIGDPGVGKTLLTLQALQGWVFNGHNPAALFIEKNRLFHTHRLLAQLAGRGSLCDWEWITNNAAEVEELVKHFAEPINEIGKYIWSKPRENMTIGAVGEWIRCRCDEGHRIILVDPITAADAGDKRWLVDNDFVLGIQETIGEYGASLILTTHSKEATTPKNRSGFGQAGGQAFFRFSDTDLWLVKPKIPMKAEVQRGRHGVKERMEVQSLVEIHKARLGRGSTVGIAMEFLQLKFRELGAITRLIKEMPGAEQAKTLVEQVNDAARGQPPEPTAAEANANQTLF
jgi:hypothetical protein